MRPIYMMMAAVAGLTLATPASAQWGHGRTYSHQFQVQIDAGVREGTISRRESFGLREDLSRLVRLERRFSPDGISGREHAVLKQRSTSLAKDIRIASRYPNRRGDRSAAWDGRAGYGNHADPGLPARILVTVSAATPGLGSTPQCASSECRTGTGATMSTTIGSIMAMTMAGSTRLTASRR